MYEAPLGYFQTKQLYISTVSLANLRARRRSTNLNPMRSQCGVFFAYTKVKVTAPLICFFNKCRSAVGNYVKESQDSSSAN